MSRLFLCCCFFGALAGCSEVNRGEQTPLYPVYRHHAGSVFIRRGEQHSLKHTFSVSNPSNTQSMHLEVDQKSCGCLATTIGSGKAPPGGQTDVTFEVTLRYIQETRRESAIMNTGLHKPKKVGFIIEADVYPRVVLQPDKHWRAKLKLKPGETRVMRGTAVAYRDKDEPDTSLDVFVRGEHVTVRSIDQNKELLPDDVWKITSEFALRIGANAGVSTTGRSFTAEVTASCGDDAFTRQLLWKVEPLIEVKPETVFAHIRGGEKNERSITLSAKKPFEIKSITCDRPFVQFEADLEKPRQQHTIRFVIARSGNNHARASRAVLRIKTNHALQPNVEAPIFILWPPSSSPAT